MNLDLDAARAARLEATKEPKSFTLDGKTYELPFELPLDVTFAWAEGSLRAGLQALLRDRFEGFVTVASDRDLQELIEWIQEQYGPDQGESPASVASLRSGGSRSRRTSSGSTG